MTMHEAEHDTKQRTIVEHNEQRHRISRAQLLALAGAGAALVALPHVTTAQAASDHLEFPFYPHVQGTYTPEDVRDILNILVTMERFAVAAGTANFNGSREPGINPLLVTTQQAANVTSLAGVDFLESLGAHALTDMFTLGGPPGIGVAGLKRKELISTIFIGAYMTAAREFAELGQPLLVKWAYQRGAQLTAEMVVTRTLQAVQGVAEADPPNNRAFETDLFVYVRDAYALMTGMGLFGGLPFKLPNPTRDQVLAAAGPIAGKVLQKVPNNATVSITSPANVRNERL